MLEVELEAPGEGALDAARVTTEGRLWPWICRFFWCFALDVHPERRDAVLPGWPHEAWSDARATSHVSRHLAGALGAGDAIAWNSASSAFRIALLPQPQLASLARRMALCAGAAAADETEQRFAAQRAPLYWRAHAGRGAEQDGWRALTRCMASEPAAVAWRFALKTPPSAVSAEAVPPGPAGDPRALTALALRILKEFDEPWCSLFVTPAR